MRAMEQVDCYFNVFCVCDFVVLTEDVIVRQRRLGHGPFLSSLMA